MYFLPGLGLNDEPPSIGKSERILLTTAPSIGSVKHLLSWRSNGRVRVGHEHI